MYEPSNGRFLSRDPLSDNGVDLLYRFPDMNHYRYARNHPVSSVDPSGSIAEPIMQDASKSGGSEEKFYVCERLVEQEGTARQCGCLHTDIYGSQSGEVYVGFLGGVGQPKNDGLPKGPEWKCTELSRCHQIVWFVGKFPRWRDLQITWGPKAGLDCKKATTADVLACLQAKPRPPGKPGVGKNCQTDVHDASTGCCLCGFRPLSLSGTGANEFVR